RNLSEMQEDEWKGRTGMEYNTRTTGTGIHSEWNNYDSLHVSKRRKLNDETEEKKTTKKKKKTKKKEPEQITGITSSFGDFMNNRNTNSFFYTGEPHCGLCTDTLRKSGLPLTYPTRARPPQSQAYSIPDNVPNQNEIKKHFGSKPHSETGGKITYLK